mmetsp:Transcript_74/g.192  ORF Transcript_74/g.192 Transcript_74/m.192 type:complete len:241 (-) Transcript_74:1230-1952(-)|eukprot:CAMPEP_0171359956 /NCGR_PEP_ID=MMETSP0879-20121228/901_1 /TAXON_ID=67004 /ORGANISM="Thalassiosira weissflogii, Strain CCMP1336" /LENGTH=240 /DNA_ID=CAMNT_0011866169 /DNA_START=41 /DNA_END=763 /DNA_ORIENTATION=+
MRSPHDCAASDDLRWRIQQEAKELSMAHQGLSSWIGEIQTAKNRDCALSANTKQDSIVRTNGGEVTRPNSSSNESISKPAYNTTCEEERIYGNKCFSEGKYSDAIESYSRCLRYKDALTSAVVYSNRAMAHIKMKNWTHAEDDANSALQIEPKHYKSYQRRCVARLSMGKIRAAMQDAFSAEECILLEIKNESDTCSSKSLSNAQSALDEIRKLRNEAESAFVSAVKRAPRRKVPISIIA